MTFKPEILVHFKL